MSVLQHAVAAGAAGIVRRSIESREYVHARRVLDRGLAHAVDHDLESWRLHLVAWRVRLLAETGHWSDAEVDALTVIADSRADVVARIPALTMLGLLHARQRKPDAADLLDEALTLARSVVPLRQLVPIRAARAELALLQGQSDIARQEAAAGLALLSPTDRFWDWEGLHYLDWRATHGWRASQSGFHTQDPIPIRGPHSLQLRGHWRAAADAWARLGCPYERADALADGDVPAMEEALQIFTGLGATPAADRVRRDLRRVGVNRLRRGPRRSTRAHPAGLTRRESEILGLLARHLSNPAIGERLFVSPKTVEHHVSAILGKLDVATRAEAVLKARHRGWLADRRRPDATVDQHRGLKRTATDSAA